MMPTYPWQQKLSAPLIWPTEWAEFAVLLALEHHVNSYERVIPGTVGRIHPVHPGDFQQIPAAIPPLPTPSVQGWRRRASPGPASPGRCTPTATAPASCRCQRRRSVCPAPILWPLLARCVTGIGVRSGVCLLWAGTPRLKAPPTGVGMRPPQVADAFLLAKLALLQCQAGHLEDGRALLAQAEEVQQPPGEHTCILLNVFCAF